ncbi:MAG: hypothetical protein DRN92_04940 [Thermoproteota archaeon]|nr:MAG: hypothetical protein DRN92_04940 [Candidatus Korarchaeota archaeon]
MLLVTPDNWPEEDLIEKELDKMKIRDYNTIKALLPYYLVDYEVRTREGLFKRGKTAINASFLEFPKELGQVVPLFRPVLLKQKRKKSETDVIVFPLSGLDLNSFFDRVIGWVQDTDKKIAEVRNALKKIYAGLRLTLILPAPPGFTRSEKKYSTVLSHLLGQKYAINLLFGLDLRDSLEEVKVRQKELFYSRVIVIMCERGPLIFEVSDKGVEFLTGLERLTNEISEVRSFINSLF